MTQPTPSPAKPAATAAPTGSDPRIVVFACNWCSYAGADTAGVSRIQHQPHFRMIRVMCSGRIQPAFVLRAFEKGADGVLVSGCHFGDCHYIFGNERAVEQFEKTMNVVKILGIDEGRLRLEWISAAEGGRFAEVIDEFTDQVRALGPSPVATTHTNDEIEVPETGGCLNNDPHGGEDPRTSGTGTDTGTGTGTGKGTDAGGN